MFIVSVQLGLLFLSPRDGGEAEELLTRQTLPVQTFALFGRVGVDPRTLSNQTRAEALAHLPLLPRHPHPRPRSGGEKKNKTTCLPSSGVSLMSSGLPRLLTTCSFSSTLPSPLPPSLLPVLRLQPRSPITHQEHRDPITESGHASLPSPVHVAHGHEIPNIPAYQQRSPPLIRNRFRFTGQLDFSGIDSMAVMIIVFRNLLH